MSRRILPVRESCARREPMHRRSNLVLAQAVVGVAFAVGLALAQVTALTVHRDGFDGPNAVWVRGAASVAFQEERHALSEKYKYAGTSSEYIRVNADAPGPQLGPFIYYVYAIPRAPVT